MSDQLTLQKMVDRMDRHDISDQGNFDRIDKRDGERVELMKINGEHLSSINKNFLEQTDKIKRHLEKQDEKLEQIDKRFEELKPLLKEVDFYKTLWGKIMEGLKKLSVVSGAIVAWYVIRDFFAK